MRRCPACRGLGPGSQRLFPDPGVEDGAEGKEVHHDLLHLRQLGGGVRLDQGEEREEEAGQDHLESERELVRV